MELAMSKSGTRQVQRWFLQLKMRSAKDGFSDLEALVAKIAPYTVRLYKSGEGIHVLCIMIATVPFAMLGTVYNVIMSKGPERLAKHRYGCRLVTAFIQHAPQEEMTGPKMTALISPIIDAAEELAKHTIGWGVVCDLIEYGAPRQRSALVRKLLPSLPWLAGLRMASLVTQRLLQFSEEHERREIAETLLKAWPPFSLEDLVVSGKYGRFVIEDLVSIAGIGSAVKDRLAKKPEVWALYLTHIAKQQVKRDKF